MNKEYIEREAALKALNEAIRHQTWSMDDKDVMYQMIDYLEKVPVVETDIDELKKEVADLNNRRHLIWAIGHDYDGCNRVESLKELIDELVSYTQLPREQVPDITSRTGRWVQSEEWAEDYTCSLCGNTAFKDDHGNYNVCTKYCPHCGAKMIKENDNE